MLFDYSVVKQEDNRWQVSKWGLGSEPTAVYVVAKTKHGYKCSCPGGIYHGYCKHTKMVKGGKR